MLGEARAFCRYARYDQRFARANCCSDWELLLNLERYGAGMVLCRGDLVLLGKRDGDAPTWPHYWNVFGGRSEPMDSGDPLATAIREVDGEIEGLDVDSLVPESLACVRVNFQGEMYMQHYFKSQITQPASQLSLGDEGNGFAEFTVDELDHLALVSQLRLILDIHFGRFPAEVLASCPVHPRAC
jgi:8-oxo-dGTP pyrophosphatase MutT (NUDIX family)